jgi:hypothetical protein
MPSSACARAVADSAFDGTRERAGYSGKVAAPSFRLKETQDARH